MDIDTRSTFYFDSEERRSTNGNFLDKVNGALLCRRRCAGPETTPLRVFRVFFQDYHNWDRPMVDRWVAYALQQAGDEELHLDLRLHAGVACKCGRSAEDDSYEEYCRWRRRRGCRQSSNRLPSRLFSCAALRSLRVAYCGLVPPEDISLPAIEALHLTGVRNPGATIQRLISGCPRLVDLTLEGCPEARRVSVLDKRLRRLSLRCCQNLESVAVDASALVAFDYRGTVLPETLLTLHGTPRISSCTVEFCDRKLFGEDDLVRVRKLLDKFADAARYLHLGSRRLGCGMETESSFSGFPTFSALRRLELTGCPESHSTTIALARILEQTPNLEALTLFMKPADNDSSSKDDLEGDMVMVTTTTDAMADFPAQCLRHRLGEFNLVHYGGDEAQRKVAEMVLGKALVLQKLCVVFPKASLALQTSLMSQIKGWVVNKSAKMMFL
ncbi:unnamed protein product [Urochloa decumbens]|uniref:F-box/LRR-repeat protein 15/At3g58940/PEG3-like LRR domain-containing protein n=1 Tax=Urochloa decumbens TaxID=240449 RepID=A0ABC9C7Y6_9POAL